VPSLHASKRSVYFLPDRVLVRDGCRIAGAATRFIEANRVPGDAEQVGITWKYVNKKGGSDRYKNNPQLPIMRYGELTLTTPQRFNFVWQTSRALAATALCNAFAAISSQAHHSGINR
jgi:hypothetical protein